MEGDPGCGKTRLAHAVAYELGYPLHACYVRSTTKAQDLLYDYDAVGRLYDIQEGKFEENRPKALSRRQYVTLGELGKAIEEAQNDIPSVVLIDEIDKADIDFPNDLLLEIDRLQFQIKECPQLRYDALKGKKREERRNFLPLILITSNREKELPKPFLRRCLFYYIDFPDENILREIVESHFQSNITPMLEIAVQHFWKFRELRNWRKIPGTSEFLDWITVLERDFKYGRITTEHMSNQSLVDLPHIETLIKTQSDREMLSKLNS